MRDGEEGSRRRLVRLRRSATDREDCSMAYRRTDRDFLQIIIRRIRLIHLQYAYIILLSYKLVSIHTKYSSTISTIIRILQASTPTRLLVLAQL